MALWPFGKKKSTEKNTEKNTDPVDTPVEQPAPVEDSASVADAPAEAPATPAPAAVESIEQAAGTAPLQNYDPVNGSTGPFDGDSVDIDDFDFSDFSDVTLALGSMRVPMPKGTQVQVEMGEQGPKMVHIVTPYGRLTPVAFAAPRTGGMWEESAAEITEGMRSEGMPVHVEEGPWGREVVGTGTNGTIRIIGIEGPRWLYRVTLAAPSGREAEMADLGRETIARSFVYRGEEPILAGNSLPVVLPAQLAAQVQQAVQARAAQQNDPFAQGQAPTGGNPNALSDALREIMEINRQQNGGADAAGDNR
ncbi:DUF3710 domain-containing protein [Corynebacterium sp. CNCTC7651]|uniref:DUF3710 domain-containing protein n=1 Tax=Corynebacterium sp. CNCTC7651 TaxID=2815361 RepID=UPI001F468F22|nr:DUF3710 domain-containing protein [Corynebacterium sp. CNCTC7651]UIZ91369.1 DUF3710 domain-containing protein [Corynebacterium sp. CNCTC7651]